MTNELQTVQQNTAFSSTDNFESAQRMAKALAASNLIPKEFQGNISNTLIALEMAQRLKASPLAVMQSLYIIHGKPSWSAQFIIAMINASGRFKPLQFIMDGEGDSRSCVALTTNMEGKSFESPIVSIQMAKDEQWYQKSGSKWKTMPELMLRYRAASFFGRLYAPDLMMGMESSEELIDIYDAKKSDDGSYAVNDPVKNVENANKTFSYDESQEPDTKEPISNGDAVNHDASLTEKGEIYEGIKRDTDRDGNPIFKTDEFGEIYDRAKHAADREGNPIFKTDGSFRKRRQPTRGAGKAERMKAETPKEELDWEKISKDVAQERSGIPDQPDEGFITQGDLITDIREAHSEDILNDLADLIEELPPGDRALCQEEFEKRMNEILLANDVF